MAKYIDKAALVAEIERRIKETESMQPKFDQFWAGQISAFKGVLKILDTLEVKEVDLDKEIELIKGDYEQVNVAWNSDFDFIARHFFELGLKARTDKELVEEVYSHLDGIKETADRMTSGNFMHHRAAIKFSANVIEKVLGLIGIKAQKGE